MENIIHEPAVERDVSGKITRILINFGPHYYIDLQPDESGILTIYAGATHHGFKAHAADVMDEWEKYINEIRVRHPDAVTD